MKFSKLDEGSYNLKITAEDASGTTKTKKVACTVTSATSASSSSASDSKLTVSPKVSPAQVYVGAGVYVSGTVTSNYKITSVTATIVGTSYTMTAEPNATSYSLSAMDSAMKFSKLTEGEYRLQVTAKDASGKEVTNYTTCTILQRSANANGTLSAMVNTALAETNANVGMYNKYNAYSGQAWCAYFVAWCARESGVSTTAIPNSYLCRNLVSYYQGQSRYYTYSQVKAGSYVPKVGDLIFYSTSSGGSATHVGLVTSVNTTNGTITTKEGNTRRSTGGSWVYSYTMSYKSNQPWSGYSQYIIGYAHPAY
jgi:cell wall-associated NlpC family hydrolase